MEETEGVLGARQGELTLLGCRVRVPACRSCLIKTRPEGRCGISQGKERGQRPRSMYSGGATREGMVRRESWKHGEGRASEELGRRLDLRLGQGR